MRRRNPSDDEIKFLARLAKKGKGTVDMDLATRALQLIGFSVEPVVLALDMAKLSDGAYTLRGILSDWADRYQVRHISDPRYGEPKAWGFSFDDRKDVSPALAELDEQIVIVDAAPEEIDVGQLYFTEIKEHSGSGSWPGFHVKKIWLGDTGWTFTAPSGKTVTVATPVNRSGQPVSGPVNIATMWTFLYKNGAAQAAADWIAQAQPDVIAEATATKAERERLARARSALPEIASVFREVTDEQYQSVVTYLEAMFVKSMQVVQDIEAAGERVQWHEIYGGPSVQRMMRQVPKGNRYEWQPKPDYETIAHQEAVRTADQAREDFVHKNTARISEIARRKDAMPTATIRRRTGGGRGGYGGDIVFEFHDGSSFVLRNKTIWKRSPLGLVFAQFPTTFHDVVLPGGKKMKPPLSEARMHDVFAGQNKAENPASWQERVAARLAQGGR